MKCLYINKLHIRPRFYVSIKDFLKTSEPEVVELKIRFTESMLNIQECIMELLDLCVRELKRINPSLTLDSSYSEEVALSSLHHSLLHQLRGVWHQTSFKTKSLIRDVNELSDLLNYLSEYDCVTFCHYLDSLRASANAENFTDAEKNLWLMLDPTNTLFQQAKKRVYTKIDQNKTLASDNIYFHLEENPKWKLLKEVLLEIQSDMDACPSFRGNVLIFAKNENTCTQIRNFLLVGGKKMLMTLYKQYIQCKPALSNLNSSPSESQGPAKKQVHGFHLKKVDLLATGGMHVVSVSYFQRLQRRRALLARDTAPGAWENVVSGQKKAEDFPNEDVFRLLPSLHITFRSIESLGGPHAMERLLFELKPTFIIFYNANLSLTRQTEADIIYFFLLVLRVFTNAVLRGL
ncbi:DNA repair endonuclease XPF-like [Zophobas morio]|uniref:DNA repair endonuclease XPF-like n=1 Tax=Zophobas morio TaxID=2755281 RepID=UPI003082D1A2